LTIRPPSIGPVRPKKPQEAPKTPCILARSSRLKMSPTMVRAMGIMEPAPRPWMARKTMSWVIDCAAPLAAEPKRKRAMPKSKIGLRP
jgi:hypothetical protein